MAEYKIRVGDTDVMADIDDPDKSDWSATVRDPEKVGVGVIAVSIVGNDGSEVRYSEADVVPGKNEDPTRLRGKRPFHK